MNLAKETNNKFHDVMQWSVVEVFTLATYLIEKVEIVKMRYGSTDPSAS